MAEDGKPDAIFEFRNGSMEGTSIKIVSTAKKKKLMEKMSHEEIQKLIKEKKETLKGEKK